LRPERWREVEAVFQAARQREPDERAAFLGEACGSDTALRREVESLLQAEAEAIGLQERLSSALAGRYRLERELGRGGMATVYLAQDLRHDRRVALKVLHPELGLGTGPERFLHEIRITARLDHPHILPVHDSGEAAGLLWYTMPYVEGESLRDRLERAGPLPVEEALRLVRQAADALDCAHRHGVVHRDVKPENVLVSGGHARVADFGIARALEAAGSERLTGTGITVGTPAYMSPEQAAGATKLDGRSDIYSLGCVLYELLAGEPPFTGSTPQAVIARRFVEPPPPIRRVRGAVPAAVEAVLTRALAREPADRFQTAAEFAERLADAELAPASVRLPHPTVTQSTRSHRPGRPRVVSRGLVFGLAAFVAALVLVLWRQSDRSQTKAAGASVLESPATLRVAVLPFEQLGDSADADFAAGLSDEIRGKLAALAELEVIAGASSGEYRGTTKPPQQVARELGVRYLLVGKLRSEKLGGRVQVRVSPELVEVGARGPPTTKWQAAFEAPLTGVFEVQAAIASQVAEALGVALGIRERQALATRPTKNLAAYQAYRRGEALWGEAGATSPAIIRQAVPYYEQAVALDSGFVEAWYRLAGAHLQIYGSGGTLSPAEAAAARTAAERALAVAPDRPEGRVALGNYYLRVPNDTRRALEQFNLALRVAPDFIDALAYAGFAEQFLGRWDVALEHFHRASILDPRSASMAFTLAQTLLWLRRYSDAHPAADRALALAPPSPNIFQLKAMIHLAQGDLAQARALVQRALGQVEPAALAAWFGWSWDLYWVLEEPEQGLLLRLPPSAYDNNRASWGLILAQTYHQRGDQGRARVYADSARLAFEEQLRGTPEDAQTRALYGLTLAYLNRKADAKREGERAVALAPLTSQAAYGAYVRHQLVRIYLLLGEPEKALDQLEPLLKIPYYLSPGWLKIDPTFASLHGHPRFKRLIVGG
jgi:serine/threonine-protein kinase